MFHGSFGLHTCPGDVMHTMHGKYKVTARVEHDAAYHIDDNDMHNPDQSVTGCSDEQFKKLMDARFAWLRDEWFYCGIVLSVSRGGVLLCENAASLWGIEANYPGSDNKYLTEVANELLPEAIDEAEKVFDCLVRS